MTLRDLQITKEKLLRSNPLAASALSRIDKTVSRREHLRALADAAKATSAFGGDARRWEQLARRR